MKYLFYCGHPAQYLFFREPIRQLNARGHKSVLLIKSKDVLESLVEEDGFEYINLQRKERGQSKLAIIFSLFRRSIVMLPIILKQRPDVLIGGDPSISQLGWLLRKNRFTLTEDDYRVIRPLANLTFPFAQAIITPSVNDVGRFRKKKIGYNGYMKLAYLHPSVFRPDPEIKVKHGLKKKYALIRLAKLTAHHDFGIKGLTHGLIDQVIGILLQNDIFPYISSEGQLDNRYCEYQLKIPPSDMHHVLSQAVMLISDSQSMSVEAAMLGIPSIRYSSFAGKISVLEELEHKYDLTFGIREGQREAFFDKLKQLLSCRELSGVFQERRKKMLSEKIDVSKFMVWFIENYPESKNIILKDPGYQSRFGVEYE